MDKSTTFINKQGGTLKYISSIIHLNMGDRIQLTNAFTDGEFVEETKQWYEVVNIHRELYSYEGDLQITDEYWIIYTLEPCK